ncbi:MAG: hypothetical protein M0C28_27860 [Candidatus Moduliflexus flocculans]|nr:hypothetical protein [Candidatus Moduliflexus flocculans]
MDSAQSSCPGEPAGAAAPPDPARTEKVKDLLHYLANTVSAMKIFPSEHATVTNFVDQLAAKFTEFLAVHGRSSRSASRNSPSPSKGSPRTPTRVAIKSLPFFFFKDGLHILFFYQGLDRPEVFDFLELIKTEAQKPAEDSDIVAALWERDFPNIQYYAPDEFLENRILAERQDSRAADADLPDGLGRTRRSRSGSTPRSSPKAGSSSTRRTASRSARPRAAMPRCRREEDGAGGVRPEAGSADRRGRRGRARRPEPGGGHGPDPDGGRAPIARDDGPRQPDHLRRSRSTSTSWSRSSTSRKSRPPAGPASTPSWSITSTASSAAISRSPCSSSRRSTSSAATWTGSRQKAALLDAFLKRTVSPKTVEAVKSLLDRKKNLDWESLLGFFGLLGPPALGLAADLFDLAPDGEARHKILGFIETTGAAHPGLLAALADPAKPDLARRDRRRPCRASPGGKGSPISPASSTSRTGTSSSRSSTSWGGPGTRWPTGSWRASSRTRTRRSGSRRP